LLFLILIDGNFHGNTLRKIKKLHISLKNKSCPWNRLRIKPDWQRLTCNELFLENVFTMEQLIFKTLDEDNACF